MRRLLLGLAIASIAALSPSWAQADDQQIAQQIVQQLRQQKTDGNLTGFSIDLEVESGIVWLKGHVASQEQQKTVIDIARRVRGVEQVVNDVQIKNAVAKAAPAKSSSRPALLKTDKSSNKLLNKPGQLLSNLNRSVKRAFRTSKPEEQNQPTPAKRPKTQVAQKQLTPPRPVPTPAQPTPAKRAEQQVVQTPAPPIQRKAAVPQPRPRRTPVQVAAVSKPKKAAPSDADLAEEIIGKLRTQKDRGTLRDFDVDVQVNNQVVWVSGRVASEAQRSLVLDVSRRVRGVKQVVNDLNVNLPAPIQTVSSPATPPLQAPVPRPAGSAMMAAQAPAAFQYAPAQPLQAPVPVPAQPTRVAQRPLAFAPAQSVAYNQQVMAQPVGGVAPAGGVARARFDNPSMPGYAWPSYAAYPNYGAVTYPRQYSPTAWPYIGPFYPYPQVPLGWRKVTLEWDDGWWMLDFKSK